MAKFECIKNCTWQNKLCEIGNVYDFSEDDKPFVYKKIQKGKEVVVNTAIKELHPYLIEIKEEKPNPEPKKEPDKKPDVKKDE